MRARLAQLGQPGWRFQLLASVPFVAAFMLVPASLFLHAGEDWDFAPRLVLYLSALGLAAYLLTAVSIWLIAIRSQRVAVLAASGLFAFGLWIVLAHVYSPVAIGPLDGEAIDSTEPLALTLREAGFLLLAIAVFVQLGRGRWRPSATALSLALIVITGGYLAMALGRAEPASATERGAIAAPKRTAPGNVYHFVLDTMQTDAFLHLLDELETTAVFRGFQLFRNNIANYRTTHTSSASYFTGTRYEGGRLGKWRVAWKNRGLFKSVSKAGYRIWMYAPYKTWREAKVDRFWYMRDVYERESGTADSDFRDFALVWLLSLVPNPLTNEAVPAAEGGSDGLYRTLVGDRKALSVPEGLLQVASIMMVEQALQHEDLRRDSGEYVYVHPTLPHGPMVVDSECRLVGREASDRRRAEQGVSFDRRGYLDQGACAMRLLEAFIDRLHRLGRYADATIVIHGDTGYGGGLINPAITNADEHILGFPAGQVVSMFNALLMVKRPYATGELEVVDRPTQLLDLYPTLVELLNLPEPEYRVEGRSIFGADRQESVFAIDPDVRSGPNLIEIRVEDPFDLERSPLKVLGALSNRRPRRDGTRRR